MIRFLLTLWVMIFLAVPGFAQDKVFGFEEDDLPILNEELRKIRYAADTITSSITITRVLAWYLSGDLETSTDTSAKFTVPFAGTIVKASAIVKTAPTSADLIIDINLNDTTLWSSGKLTVSATDTTGSKTTFDSTSVSVDDTIDIDIDQIGSGTAGANLTVQLHIDEAINSDF